MLTRTIKTFVILVALIHPCSAEPQPFPPTRFETTLLPAGHVITVTITSKKFDRAKHEMKVDPSGASLLAGHPKIDGHWVYGVDGYSIPEEEFDKFEVVWDGKPVSIPRALYADCYTPVLCRVASNEDSIGNNQNKEKIGNMLVIGDEKGESILIIMRGYRWASDCYRVYWTICKDGHHSRFIQNFGS